MKKQLFVLLALISSFAIAAQSTWKGGFPGQENNWFCARNWSDNQVPNNLDNVVIPDRSTSGNYYPVIAGKQAQVQSLDLHSGAQLTIEPGAQLSVLGYGLPGGALLNLGAINNHGTLEVVEPVLHALEYSGKGTLIHRKSNLTADDFVCETTTVCL